ncbi:Endonuclease/exonuclease/phosphatase [Russula brevipes]|nr:Endonuclease/exonuclease/phosphatase [Russula brevipes]
MRGATSRANGRNIPTAEKWQSLGNTIHRHKLAILAVQETHLDQDKLNLIRTQYNKNLEIIGSADPEEPTQRAGVAFIINKNKLRPKEISSHVLVPGRALIIKFKWLEGYETSILNIYAPVVRAEQPQFWADVEKERQRLKLNRPNLVIGDFNVTEDAIDRAPARLDNLTAVESIRKIRQDWGIQDAWRHAYPKDREFTYRTTADSRASKSRLDRIYAGGNLQNQLYEWYIGATSVHTDHWLVKVKFAPDAAPHIGKGRWTCPVTLLNDLDLINKIKIEGISLQRNIESLNNDAGNLNSPNPQTLWEKFKLDIRQIAKKHAQKAYHRTKTHTQKIEKDRKELTESPDFDNREDLRTNEAFLAKPYRAPD